MAGAAPGLGGSRQADGDGGLADARKNSRTLSDTQVGWLGFTTAFG